MGQDNRNKDGGRNWADYSEDGGSDEENSHGRICSSESEADEASQDKSGASVSEQWSGDNDNDRTDRDEDCHSGSENSQ